MSEIVESQGQIESLSPGSSEQPIDPQIYNLLIEHIAPLGVRLESLSFDLRASSGRGSLVTVAQLHAPEYSGNDDKVHTLTQRAEFQIQDADGIAAATGIAAFSVLLRAEIEPPKNFWDIFLIRNVKLYTQPVLRELLASLAMRSGLVAAPIGSVAVTQVIR